MPSKIWKPATMARMCAPRARTRASRVQMRDDGPRDDEEEDSHEGHESCADGDGEQAGAAGAGGIAGSDGVADGDRGSGGDSQRNHIGVGSAAEDDFVRGERDGREVRGHHGGCAERGDFKHDLRRGGQAEFEQSADARPVRCGPVCRRGRGRDRDSCDHAA